jgi:hypothetical protein
MFKIVTVGERRRCRFGRCLDEGGPRGPGLSGRMEVVATGRGGDDQRGQMVGRAADSEMRQQDSSQRRAVEAAVDRD